MPIASAIKAKESPFFSIRKRTGFYFFMILYLKISSTTPTICRLYFNSVQNVELMVEEDTPKEKEIKTPKWLRRLEKESWQAELLISGLALFGSFQLPEITYWLIDLFIKNLPDDQYFWGYVIAYMSLFGVSILSTFFIIHLVLRAYWIGLIGVNSVFPQGYKIENDMYSPLYTKKITDELPTIPETIHNVDELCSTLFSSAFVFLMIYGSLSLLGIPFIFLYNFLSEYVPSFLLNIPLYIFLFILGTTTIISTISFIEGVKKNEKIQNFYVKLTNAFNWFNPFSKYINQIMMTFMTNSEKGKSRFLLTIMFLLCAMTLSFTHFQSSNISLLIKGKAGDNSFFQSNRMYPNFYENQYSEGKEILNPIISSDQVSGKFLSVFIPVFRNEGFIRDRMCDTYVPDSTKSEDDNMKMEKEQRIFCSRKYHQVYVNDSLYQVEFLSKNHTNKDESGIVAYLPTDDFVIGKNLLEVVKIQDEEGTIFQRTEIPFWFEGQFN